MNHFGWTVTIVIIFIAIFGFLVLSNQGKDILNSPQISLELPKKTFMAREPVVVTVKVEKPGNKLQSFFPSLVKKAFAKEDVPFDVTYTRKDGAEVDFANEVEPLGENTYKIITKPTQSFPPGDYTMHVTSTQGLISKTEATQDFSWGVLAINPSKPTYLPGEQAHFAMAVLNEKGEMVCRAGLTLKISDPNGNVTTLSSKNGDITVSPDCEVYDITDEPDYQAFYDPPLVGEYKLELTGETVNGTHTITDAFAVLESKEYEIYHETHTRIYPLRDYPVSIHVVVQKDFEGYLEELVPASFEIKSIRGQKQEFEVVTEGNLKKIRWPVRLKAGEKQVFSYIYDAPDVSPQFYLLGRSSLHQNGLQIYEERRRWQVASDVPVVIDSSVSTTSTAHGGVTQTTVFTAADIGYTFYKDANGSCVYSKTTDGGSTWAGAVAIDSQTDCLRIAVWYDQWTPGDVSGTTIHVGTMDSGSDDLWYTALDTTDDSQTTTVNATGANQSGTFTAGTNFNSITVGTDGDIYMGVTDSGDAFVVKCTSACDSSGNWAEAGTNPFDLANDPISLTPLSGGDILVVRNDISTDDFDSKVYDDSANSWDGSWTDIDTSASENSTYDASFSTSVNQSTGNVNLAYAANIATLGTDDEIRSATFSDSSRTWTNKADVLASTSYGVTGVGLARDSTNSNVYVIYSARTNAADAASANVYWKQSTDGMDTWGSEQGPLNSSPDDIYGAGPNAVNAYRIYVTWVETTPDDLFGETVAEIVQATPTPTPTGIPTSTPTPTLSPTTTPTPMLTNTPTPTGVGQQNDTFRSNEIEYRGIMIN